MTMRFLKLTLAYDGTNYAGWQVQPNGPTIQEKLELALKNITGETIRAVASGRTDAGVHALAQVVSFQTESQLSPEVLCKAINANMPRDIAVINVCEAPPGFHAIRDALGKRYRYVICDGPVQNIFLRHYAWQLLKRLDVEAMHVAAQSLLGKHDFSSFEASGSERKTSVRTIGDIFVDRRTDEESEKIVFEIEADGFLYNMVRNIVGTLVEVGRGRQSTQWPAQVLAAKDRQQAGPTAPPQGLFLVRVEYNNL